MKIAKEVKIGDVVQGKNGTAKIKVARIEVFEGMLLFYDENGDHLPADPNDSIICGISE